MNRPNKESTVRTLRLAAQSVRSRLFDLLLAVWTALFGLAVPVLTLLRARDRTIRAATRYWARGVLFGLKHVVGLDYVERGREALPEEPCLIVCNHQSTWETIAFLLLVPDVAIIAKDELIRIPVFGWYLRRSPMIIIDRDAGMRSLKAMVDESRAVLAQGRSVLIFPEGTRGSGKDELTFKRGVGMLYSRLDVPVVPVAVNSGKFWGRNLPYKRPGTITVSYRPVISSGLSTKDFIKAAEDAVEAGRENLNRTGGGTHDPGAERDRPS
ncbi:MAG: lysophospholipid acyltransferase family protein [Limimaricola soesokkakensis]|uniref:lysophospholipid acyltransferase family protein n=1 Tax=Limimaricola soesokkakensis TaxID=1343159 RepID=UPI004058231A